MSKIESNQEDEEMQITDTIKTGEEKPQSQLPENINISNLKEVGLSNY